MDELRKQYSPVIEYVANNCKSCIKDNSINVEKLLAITIMKFPSLNYMAIEAVVRKMCTQIEIDSISSGVNIEDLKITIYYKEDEK